MILCGRKIRAWKFQPAEENARRNYSIHLLPLLLAKNKLSLYNRVEESVWYKIEMRKRKWNYDLRYFFRLYFLDKIENLWELSCCAIFDKFEIDFFSKIFWNAVLIVCFIWIFNYFNSSGVKHVLMKEWNPLEIKRRIAYLRLYFVAGDVIER